MRAAGDQAKMACGNLQMCAGLKAGIDGSTHAMVQQRLERAGSRRIEEVAGSSDEEEATVNVEVGLNNLII